MSLAGAGVGWVEADVSQLKCPLASAPHNSGWSDDTRQKAPDIAVFSCKEKRLIFFLFSFSAIFPFLFLFLWKINRECDADRLDRICDVSVQRSCSVSLWPRDRGQNFAGNALASCSELTLGGSCPSDWNCWWFPCFVTSMQCNLLSPWHINYIHISHFGSIWVFVFQGEKKGSPAR